MNKMLSLMVAMGCVCLGFAGLRVIAADAPAGAATEKKACMMQSVFVCADCKGMAAKAGKCVKCEKELAEKHVLCIKDGEVMACACPAACTCKAADVKDNMCACGKTVMKMSAKGMCVCPNGCPKISSTAEKCGCGKEMKKVE